MQIERVELFIVRMPLIRTFVTSSSVRTHLDHILVKVSSEGQTGWGECAVPPTPYYSEETTETCWHLLQDFLAPAILDASWQTIEELTQSYGKVRRNNFAKAGLEMACWDLLGRRTGEPLHRLLGGTRSQIESGVSLGIEPDTGRLLDLVDQYLAEGYRRIKLKIAPGRDVNVVAAVRERHPDTPIMVDANSAYSIADLDCFRELDTYDLMLIEQPLAHDDIMDHARLQEQLETPICLDESIITTEDARKALELGSCRVINVKVSRLGGLLEAKRLHDYCHPLGVPVWCGGMHEYGIGRAANVALASLPGFTMPGDVSGSDKYYEQDVVQPPIKAIDGLLSVPEDPGLGYEADEALIAERTTRSLALP